MTTKTEKRIKQDIKHDILTYDINNIFFGTPEPAVVKDSSPPISFHLIPIRTINPAHEEEQEDGTIVQIPESEGDLYLELPELFSFGVQANTDPKDKTRITGYSLSLSCWDQGGIPTEEQKIMTDKIQAMLDKFKIEMCRVNGLKDIQGLIKFKKDEIELKAKQLNKLLYWKIDKENPDDGPVKGQGPTISPKLIYYAPKDNKPAGWGTTFYLKNQVNNEGEPLEVSPADYISTEGSKKYFKAKPILRFDAIFVNQINIALQYKTTEADIEVSSSGPKRFLHHSALNRKPAGKTISAISMLNKTVPTLPETVTPQELPQLIKELADDISVDKKQTAAKKVIRKKET
jgi:Protein of unknown function (DUF2738)